MKTVTFDEALWRVAPVEPDHKMLDAAQHALFHYLDKLPEAEKTLAKANGRTKLKLKHAIRYRAMLAAAPNPPTALDRLQSVEGLEEYLKRQWTWSKETFGPALRTKGIIQHIGKELREIEADPHDLMEWVDVVILAMDGFWRHGGKPADLLAIMQAKQDKNFARQWPDWRTMGEDQAIEHDRSGEGRNLLSTTPQASATAQEPESRASEDKGGEVAGWRDIASAPTNRAILVRVPNLDYYGNEGVYAGMHVDMGTGKHWLTFGWAIGRDLGPECQPDAWMPLPSAFAAPRSPDEAQEAVKVKEALAAIEEVIALSDRKTDAWDRAKSAVATLRALTTPPVDPAGVTE